MSKTKPTSLKSSEHQRESHVFAWNRYAGNQVLECVDPSGRQGTGRETVASGMVVPSSAMDLGLHPCLLSQALSNCFSCFAIVLAWNLQLCQPSHCLSVCLSDCPCLLGTGTFLLLTSGDFFSPGEAQHLGLFLISSYFYHFIVLCPFASSAVYN